jgi:hypothetical protein
MLTKSRRSRVIIVVEIDNLHIAGQCFGFNFVSMSIDFSEISPNQLGPIERGVDRFAFLYLEPKSSNQFSAQMSV